MTAKTEASDYVPTGNELEDAIGEVIAKSDSSNPTVRQIQQGLEKEHPTWKVPERRVRKFSKRVKNAKPPKSSPEKTGVTVESEGVAENPSPVAKLRRSLVGSARNLFRRSPSKKDVPKSPGGDTSSEASPAIPDSVPTAIAFESEAEAADNGAVAIEVAQAEVPSETAVADAPPTTALETAKATTTPQTTDVYEDDNTGSKSDDCQCAGACVIL